MKIGIGDRVPYPSRLVSVFVLVGLEQGDVAAHFFVGGVDIAEDLRPRGISQLVAAVDVDQRSLLLALIAVEDAQRNVEAEAEGIFIGTYAVKRRIVRPPCAVG